jgi:glycosyltransferase involved in cell wall biosynthesis
MSLRVAIDVTTAVTQRAGVGRYTRDLVQALADLPDGPELRPFYIAPQATYPLEAAGAPRAVHRSIRGWRFEVLARHLARLPAAGPWQGADVYHAPDVVFPPVRNLPVVATIFDLSYVVHPRFHTRLNGTYLRAMTPLTVRKARRIIAISEATKGELMRLYAVPEERIRVAQIPVSAAFLRPPDAATIAEARRHYGLTDPFLLSVGTLEPRKNLHGLLRAYRLLRERRADAPVLALAGASGWGLDQARLLGSAGESSVRRLGYVPDEHLAALYASCSAFIYVSLYEGWGLPVAEAMALGAPVVTSSVSSLPEVAGDAALLADPEDPDSIARAMESVIYETKVAERLRLAGLERARRFTARSWAQATLNVYREAASG